MKSRIYLPSLSLILLIGQGCGTGSSDSATASSEVAAGLIPKEVGGKYGYVDSLGNTVIEPQFDYAYPFSEGRALIKIGKDPHGKYGFIDASGEMVIPAKYDGAHEFSEGLASVGMGDENGMNVDHWGFINDDGAVVIPLNLEGAGSFHEGLASFSESLGRSRNFQKVFGFIDKQGKVQIPAKFNGDHHFGFFLGGLAPVAKTPNRNDQDLWGFIDKKGSVVVPFQFQNVESAERWAGINDQGDKVEVWINEAGEVAYSGDGNEDVPLDDDISTDEEPDWRDDEAAGDSTLVPVKELSKGSVTDSDGNTYATIKIGKQEWMAENLRTLRYQNGDRIPFIGATEQDNVNWIESLNGACSSYNINPENALKYGLLYNWYAVSDPRNVCPAGWHVPSVSDWTTLEVSLGVGVSDLDRDEYKGVGGKMKVMGTEHWMSPNSGATNESGFSGLPSGLRASTAGADFYNLRSQASWWSATQYGELNAWGRDVYSNSTALRRELHNKTVGASVRCVRD